MRQGLKEACGKDVGRRTEMSYKAESPGKTAQHVKAQGTGDTVNDAVVQRKFTPLSGETCFPCGMTSIPVKYRQGRPVPECPGTDNGRLCLSVRYEPKMSRQETSYAASCGAIRRMREQESAEAIVAQRRE